MSFIIFCLLTVSILSASQAQIVGEDEQLRNQAKAERQLVTTVPSVTSTELGCCNDGTAAINNFEQHMTNQVEDGIPIWAIVILSLSVILGVVGLAIIVVFVVFSIKQNDEKKKKLDREKTVGGTNGVIPRLTDLDHSCTVIMDMIDIDNPHNESSTATNTTQPTRTSICLHTSDNRVIDVPLSADGYAIPCEATIRHSTARTPSQSDSNVTNHEYEECPEESRDNLIDSLPPTMSQPTTATDTRSAIHNHQDAQRYPVPYAKVNMSLKKTKEQLTNMNRRNRLTSQDVISP